MERQVLGAVQRAIRQTLATATPVRHDRLAAADIGVSNQAAPHWDAGLRVLGQAGGTYIIAEGRRGSTWWTSTRHTSGCSTSRCWRRGGAPPRVHAARPEVLEIGARELSVLRDHFDAARALGYDASRSGRRRCWCVASGRARGSGPARDVPFGDGQFHRRGPPQDWRDRLAILFACHNAVRAGDRLTEQEMEALLDQLGEAELCHACSHGRPTAIPSHRSLRANLARFDVAWDVIYDWLIDLRPGGGVRPGRRDAARLHQGAKS